VIECENVLCLVASVSRVSVSRDGVNLEQKVNNIKKKVNNFENFLERSDLLAAKLLLSQEELADFLGIGRTTLWGYRKGTRPINGKAWRKLEDAERAAGIDQVTRKLVAEKQLTHDELSEPYKNQVTRDEFSEMGAKLDRLTDLVEQLLDQRATSSLGRGQAVKSKKQNSA
jgi:transcriptional regulator with XRE-family HTH domain